MSGKIDPSKQMYVDSCWKVVDVTTSGGGRGSVGGGDGVDGGGRGLVCGSSLLVYFNFCIELKSKITS